MDNESSKVKKVDYSAPEFVVAIISAGWTDFILFFALLTILSSPGLFIVTVPFHWVAGAIVVGALYGKLRHFIPKAILVGAAILPLPLLLIGIGLAILSQNRFIEWAVIEASIEAGKRTLEVGALLLGPGAIAAEPVIEGVGTAAEISATGEKVAEGGRALERVGEKALEVGKELGKHEARERGHEVLDRLADRGGENGEEGEPAFDEALGEQPDVFTQTMREDVPEDIQPDEEEEGAEDEEKSPDMVELSKNTVNLKKAA